MIWKEISNIFSKEESIESLTARHWKDEFFYTIWNKKWFKFPHGFILHSNFFPTSTHMPKSELKRRNYGLDKLEKKNRLLSKNCRDQASCHDQETWSRPKNLCRDQKTVATRKLGYDLKKHYCDKLAVSRPKTLQKPKKRLKIDILT